MQYSSIFLTSVLAALVSASPAIDPLTVTSLSPAQVTAYASAEAAYLQSLTADPAFTSLVLEIATDSSALAAFTSAAGALATISPSNADAIAEASSLIAGLPGPAASFYNSVLSEDVAIASSVVNNVSGGSGGTTKGASSGTASTGTHSAHSATSTGTAAGGSTTQASTSAGSASPAASGSGAAPTNAVIKAAGVAIGIFGAAVAML